MTFVLPRRSESSEHCILRGFQREEEIVSAVDHQGRHRHPGCEVNFIDFRQLLAGVETSASQNEHLDAFFEGRKDVPEICPCVQAVIGEVLMVEVITTLDV